MPHSGRYSIFKSGTKDAYVQMLLKEQEDSPESMQSCHHSYYIDDDLIFLDSPGMLKEN